MNAREEYRSRKKMFENLEKMSFDASSGKYDIPTLLPVDRIDDGIDFIPFNFAKTAKSYDIGVHFFIDDYQFDRLWSKPDRYCEILKPFRYVLSPDFSIYWDVPIAVQIWKHYQKQWIGCYMQSKGIDIIPTIAWSDERSFDFCFDGIPKDSAIAISSVGTQEKEISIKLFEKGFNEVIQRLRPTQILLFGKIPKNLDVALVFMKNGTLITHIPHYFDVKFKKLRHGRKG